MEGVIIAGGYSTRFGDRDKAVAELAGTPMIRRVADRLAEVVDALVINCRHDQVNAIDDAMGGSDRPHRFAEDPEPDQGPVAGIRTGLQAVESDYAAVVACDMPFVDPDFLAYLRTRAADYDAAVPQLDDEWYQTTQAVYRASAMVEACQAALDRGDRKIIAPLFELEYVVVGDAEIRANTDVKTFENINTQAELEAATAELS